MKKATCRTSKASLRSKRKKRFSFRKQLVRPQKRSWGQKSFLSRKWLVGPQKCPWGQNEKSFPSRKQLLEVLFYSNGLWNNLWKNGWKTWTCGEFHQVSWLTSEFSIFKPNQKVRISELFQVSLHKFRSLIFIQFYNIMDLLTKERSRMEHLLSNSQIWNL